MARVTARSEPLAPPMNPTEAAQWKQAESARSTAYKLLRRAERLIIARHTEKYLASAWNHVADAFEVAADAYEVVGDESKSSHLIGEAARARREAFGIDHEHIGSGFYRVSDREAGRLARVNGQRLPRLGYILRGKLGHAGPEVELLRTKWAQSRRGWVWAVVLFPSHARNALYSR